MGLVEKELNDLRRFREISAVLSEEGFGFVLSKLRLRSRLPLVRRFAPDREAMPAPERLRITFERLGPTFIKFGQILSQRPDIVPEEYIAELEKLTDDVPPFDFDLARDIVEEELGPVEETFEHFEREPIAAASIAQVHRATLKNGDEVVVKIRRPGIKEQIETDIDILLFMAKRGEKHVSLLENLDAYKSVKEFARWTRDELNLEHEGRNARILQKNLEDEERVKVPDVYPEHTTEKVLVMEYVEGIKSNDTAALQELDIDAAEVAQTAVRAGLKQTVRDGFFHADPHPSNFLISPEGKIIYLDFGMMGKLTMTTRRNLGLLLLHAANEDVDAAVDVIRKMGTLEDDADLGALKEDVEESILAIRNTTLAEQSITLALFDIAARAHEHGVHMPSSLTIMAKSMLTMEGIGLTIYPEFQMSEEFEKVTEHLLLEMNSPRKLLHTFLIDMIQNRDLFVRAPSQLSRVLDGLSTTSTTTVDVDSGIDTGTIVAGALILSSTFFLLEAVPPDRMLLVGVLELLAAIALILFR